jgi:hypothetical protein
MGLKNQWIGLKYYGLGLYLQPPNGKNCVNRFKILSHE